MDTPKEIDQKQMEIFFSRPLKERIRLNFELSDFIREMARRRILRRSPGMPEYEMKAALFQEFYQSEFSDEDMERICAKLKN
jgi:hypothetical protein